MSLPSHVMIVCGNVPARERTATALRSEGCAVVEAADADFARELLARRSEVGGAIVSVEQMGLMDGFEFARVLIDQWPGVERIVVIGSDADVSRVPNGASYLQRPVDPAFVCAVLSRPTGLRLAQ